MKTFNDLRESRVPIDLTEAAVSRSDFEKLKKGMRIEIDFGSSISSSQKRVFTVKSTSRSAKYNVDKVNMTIDGKGKYHLYSRNGKDATLALGNMAASIKSYKILGTNESIEEVYRKPTAAEIAADKAKERKASGSKGPDSSARYKNMKKKMYGNAMGGLKKEESQKELAELDEAKLSDMGIHNKIADRNLLIKAIKTAEKMGGNMTGAVREIEKMKKGLSKHKAVQSALQQANESVELGEAADFEKISNELLKHKKKGIEFEKAAAFARVMFMNSSLSVQDKAFMGLTKLLKDMDDLVKRTTITKILKDNGFRVKGGKLMREEVEPIVENYRTLATKGMGAETKNSINVGRGVDFYEPKNGDKRMGKITKMTKSGYVVKDEKDGKSYTFAFHDSAKAKALLAKHGKGKYNE